MGGGHNGLVAAAFYLARAGMRTPVLERRGIVGGACVTEGFAPGYRASPGPTSCRCCGTPCGATCGCGSAGCASMRPGRRCTCIPTASFGSRRRPRSNRRRGPPASARDARAFEAYESTLERIARSLVLVRSGRDPRLRRVADLPALARLGGLALTRRRDLGEIAYLFTASAKRYLDERFEDELLKSALGWESISNTLAGPSTPGTAYGLLHEAASGGGSGGGVGWGFVRGGMGVVTALMAEAAREAGATIRTGASVASVRTAGDRATGVVLEDGEEIASATVLSNADPKRTFLGLVGEERLPSAFVERVRSYRSDGASLKLNLAVAELPRLADDHGGDVRPYHRGLVQITKPLADLDDDQASARRGVPATTAHLEVCVPTVHDPSLAPEGRHVVTVGVRSQPYRLRDASWDDVRDDVADRAVARLGEHFPNLPGSVLHREILTPLDLERRLALTGGHHLHGDMSPDQLLFLRPVRGYADHRTPIRGLYLCGAGTHPGGGVTGANGRNGARRVLGDLGRRR
ncbi:MAG: NAD(P)/FAD-dependent oxidoreductase [Actinomycetota bacterium]